MMRLANVKSKETVNYIVVEVCVKVVLYSNSKEEE